MPLEFWFRCITDRSNYCVGLGAVALDCVSQILQSDPHINSQQSPLRTDCTLKSPPCTAQNMIPGVDTREHERFSRTHLHKAASAPSIDWPQSKREECQPHQHKAGSVRRPAGIHQVKSAGQEDWGSARTRCSSLSQCSWELLWPLHEQVTTTKQSGSHSHLMSSEKKEQAWKSGLFRTPCHQRGSLEKGTSKSLSDRHTAGLVRLKDTPQAELLPVWPRSSFCLSFRLQFEGFGFWCL